MRSALVTGSSGDIGRSVCRKLAADGWSLYLHYHSNKKVVDDLIYEFTILYPEQDFFPLQVNLEEDRAIESLNKQIFSLNAIIFAHGTTEYGLLKDLTSEKMDKLWKMHVKIPILITQAFQNKLHRDRNGRIVFISSVYGEMGSGNEVFYSTVKGAQLAFVRAFSKEVASWGITVNAISPGAIDTHMNEHYSDNDLEVLKQEIPMRRLGKVSEISFWVSQLLQPESSYMTGQSLTISGGWLK